MCSSRFFNARSYPGNLSADLISASITEKYLQIADDLSFTWVAELDAKIIGLVKIKRGNHVSLLFVRQSYWKNGIGKKLFDAAIKEIVSRDIQKTFITVNSSNFALKFYQRMGFFATAEQGFQTPMKLTLK